MSVPLTYQDRIIVTWDIWNAVSWQIETYFGYRASGDATWTTSLVTDDGYVPLGIVQVGDMVLIYGWGGFFRSYDGGTTWAELDQPWTISSMDGDYTDSGMRFIHTDGETITLWYPTVSGQRTAVCRYSSDEGTSWSDVVTLHTEPATTQVYADMALDPITGSLYYAYASFVDDGSGDNWANTVFIRSSDDMGATWSSPTTIASYGDVYDVHDMRVTAWDGHVFVGYNVRHEMDFIYHPGGGSQRRYWDWGVSLSYSHNGGGTWATMVVEPSDIEPTDPHNIHGLSVGPNDLYLYVDTSTQNITEWVASSWQAGEPNLAAGISIPPNDPACYQILKSTTGGSDFFDRFGCHSYLVGSTKDAAEVEPDGDLLEIVATSEDFYWEFIAINIVLTGVPGGYSFWW